MIRIIALFVAIGIGSPAIASPCRMSKDRKSIVCERRFIARLVADRDLHVQRLADFKSFHLRYVEILKAGHAKRVTAEIDYRLKRDKVWTAHVKSIRISSRVQLIIWISVGVALGVGAGVLIGKFAL